jgi:hypothetical protein
MADCTCELLMHYADCEYDGPDLRAEDLNALRALLERWDRAVTVAQRLTHAAGEG